MAFNVAGALIAGSEELGHWWVGSGSNNDFIQKGLGIRRYSAILSSNMSLRERNMSE